MEKNKTGKYLKYAIGEIALVVIGILIALQINNWNEQRKDSIIEKVYLEGIKNDLKKDIEQANFIIGIYLTPLNIIDNIDSNFKLDSTLKLQNIDTFSMSITSLFRKKKSFRPTKGTYSSLIADGKSNLITNRILFQKIQSIYDEQQSRILSLYDSFKTRENSLTAEYSYEKFNWDYKTLTTIKNNKVLATLSNFWDLARWYCIYLRTMISEINILIAEINVELKK